MKPRILLANWRWRARDLTGLGRGRENRPQLVGAEGRLVLIGQGDPDQPEHPIGDEIDDPDQRAEDHREDPQRIGDPKGSRLRALDGPNLGRLFAEGHVQGRHDGQGNGQRNAVKECAVPYRHTERGAPAISNSAIAGSASHPRIRLDTVIPN